MVLSSFLFPFHAKVFFWCTVVGGLHLAMTSKQRYISSGTCDFCRMINEDSKHNFISCNITKVKYYCENWKYFTTFSMGFYSRYAIEFTNPNI
jgi:hypothetical protein